MTDYEFQDRIVIGELFYLVMIIQLQRLERDHFYLKPGKYLNLYPELLLNQKGGCF